MPWEPMQPFRPDMWYGRRAGRREASVLRLQRTSHVQCSTHSASLSGASPSFEVDPTPQTKQNTLELLMYTDETLNCVDCNAAFIFSAGEQEFFAQKGFANKPNRCPDCRAARKANKGGGGGSAGSYGGGGGRSSGGGYGGGGGGGTRPQREMFQATCSACGKVAEVPFQPRGDKPVYCRECFSSKNTYR